MATFYELVSKRKTDMYPDKYILRHRIAPGRRRYNRLETLQAVSVYWEYEKLEDTARVRDVSLAGLFVATQKMLAVVGTLRLDCLVLDATIKAAGVVSHLD